MPICTSLGTPAAPTMPTSKPLACRSAHFQGHSRTDNAKRAKKYGIWVRAGTLTARGTRARRRAARASGWPAAARTPARRRSPPPRPRRRSTGSPASAQQPLVKPCVACTYAQLDRGCAWPQDAVSAHPGVLGAVGPLDQEVARPVLVAARVQHRRRLHLLEQVLCADRFAEDR